jgi:hypothetical protein
VFSVSLAEQKVVCFAEMEKMGGGTVNFEEFSRVVDNRCHFSFMASFRLVLIEQVLSIDKLRCPIIFPT